jgi:hypothetical protein
LARYLNGFDDANHTATAPGLPNHVAWILGHCALTMHRAAEKLDGTSRVAESFIPGAASGDARRFGTESVAFGSNPNSEGVVYPGYARCTEIFGDAAEHLAAAIRRTPEPALDESVPFIGGTLMPRWSIAPRIVFHNGTHCGQIADLRRALGMKSVFA